MLDIAKQQKKQTADAEDTKSNGGSPDLPKWWTRLDEKQQEFYLRLHPQSKMHKVASAALQQRLKSHPKERVALRDRIAKMAADPLKFLKHDFNKLDNAQDKLTKDQKKEVETSVREAGKKPHKILKAVMTTLAVAGVLTLGAGLIASGGLPYAIIAGRCFKDTLSLTKEIQQRVRDGEHTVSAVFSSVKNTISKTMRDPRLIAATLMLQTRKQDDDSKKKDSDAKPEKKEKKKPHVQKHAKRKAKHKEQPA